MDNKQAIKLMKSIRNVYSWSVNCEKALDKAIASLEAWDKVLEEIDNINLNEVAKKYEDRFYGFQREVIKIIDKYKESEESD